MRRREFIAGLGSAAAWPLAARAQQPVVPVIGYLGGRSAESDVSMLAAFRRGLAEIGYTVGRDVSIEYRFADGQTDRLPALAEDLTGRHVAVIIYAGAGGNSEDAVWRPLRASNIPIVFAAGGSDPVRSGLVSSFNRPRGNITGIFSLNVLMGKHMGLLHELAPDAKTIAVLLRSQNNQLVKDEAREPAASLRVQLLFFPAGSDGEIDAAFAAMNQQRVEALVVATNVFFVTRAKLIASLARRYRLPAMYARREFAEAGGLMSYGYDVADGYRRLGGMPAGFSRAKRPVTSPCSSRLNSS
jgi:putative ABC transport system substrate-binding protein